MSNDYDKPTPHDTLKDFIPPSKDEIEEMKAKRIERMKRLANGEPEPPPDRQGICRVCGGIVRTKYVAESFRPSWEAPVYGGSKPNYNWVAKGTNCQSCGVMYSFIPSPITARQSDEEG